MGGGVKEPPDRTQVGDRLEFDKEDPKSGDRPQGWGERGEQRCYRENVELCGPEEV